MNDKQCLIYVHEKLRVILGEHQSCDYMKQLRGIINNTPKNVESGGFLGSIDELKCEEEENE